MAARHNFRKLTIWKEGIELAKDTAVSVPSNIAEGSAKGTDRHFIQYLENSLGSAFEWETQLIIAFEIGYISKETFEHLERKIQSIQGMITRFIENLNQHNF